MAVKDVKKYYYTMLGQYCAEKENLADYEQAFKDGHITEDQLTDVKEYFSILEQNFERIKYIMFLLNAPNRASKKPKYEKQNKALLKEFEAADATLTQVEAENEAVMQAMNEELDGLTK